MTIRTEIHEISAFSSDGRTFLLQVVRQFVETTAGTSERRFRIRHRGAAKVRYVKRGEYVIFDVDFNTDELRVFSTDPNAP
jgi:hypothetical protein